MRPLLVALLLLVVAPAPARAAVTVQPAAAPEAEGQLLFRITTDSALGELVNVTTQDETATAGKDYTAQSRQVTVPSGATGTTVAVPVTEEQELELDETFGLKVTPLPAGAAVSTRGTIRNDEAPPFAAVAEPVPEGAEGTATVARITVGLLAPTTKPVTVAFATVPGTATTPADFAGRSGTIELPPGEQVRTLEVPVRGDGVFEGAHGFDVRFSEPVNTTLQTPVLPVAITEDDPAPTLTVVPAPASDEGTGQDTVTGALLRLSAAAEVPVAVAVATRNREAKAPGDFRALSTAVTFAPGETQQPVLVAVRGDDDRERDERFELLVAGLGNVTVPGGTITVPLTIRDDDADTTGPAVSVQSPRLRGGRVAVRVACPAAEARCRVTLTLRRAGRRVGRAVRATLAGGSARTLRVSVPRSARRGLVTATVVARDDAGDRTTRRRTARLG